MPRYGCREGRRALSGGESRSSNWGPFRPGRGRRARTAARVAFHPDVAPSPSPRPAPGRRPGGGTPGTEAAQELAYVSDQILVDLGRIDPHLPSSLSGERSLHLLGPEPRQAVPRLDHDRGHGRVTPQGQEPPTRSVQGRANLGQKAPDGEPLLGRPSGT